MRETIKSEAFYSNVISAIDEDISSFSRLVDRDLDDFPTTIRRAFALNSAYQRKVIAMYSRGDAIDHIKPVYLMFLENFEDLVERCLEDFDYVYDRWSQPLDGYYRVMSWAILFEVDARWRKDFVIDLDFFGRQKTGDIMLQKIGVLDRVPTDRLGGQPAYEPLLQALEAKTAARQEEKLKQFLTQWYSALRQMNVTWIDDHKKADLHFGYWCFEAAAAVKHLQLDPEVFKDMPYFPYDLATP